MAKRRERQRAIDSIYGSTPYERPVIDMKARRSCTQF
jgi:hypothetical protein